jgi:ABC-type lipoprotein export system ATPase subunit
MESEVCAMPFVKKSDSQGFRLSNDISNIFVGRSNELHFFRQHILKPEVPSHNILSISGQGGVGKSTLLKRLITEAESIPI